jgi:ABC-type multidrug transport system ATPase subunit
MVRLNLMGWIRGMKRLVHWYAVKWACCLMGVLFESNGLFQQLSALENLEIIARINRIDSSIWLPKCEKLLDAVELR